MSGDYRSNNMTHLEELAHRATEMLREHLHGLKPGERHGIGLDLEDGTQVKVKLERTGGPSER